MRATALLILLASGVLLAGCRKPVAPGGYATESRNAIRIVATPEAFPPASAAAERFARTEPHYRAPVVEKTRADRAFALFCGGLGGRFPDAIATTRAPRAEEAAACRRNGVAAVQEIAFGSGDAGHPAVRLLVKRQQLGFMAGLELFVSQLPELAAAQGSR